MVLLVRVRTLRQNSRLVRTYINGRLAAGSLAAVLISAAVARRVGDDCFDSLRAAIVVSSRRVTPPAAETTHYPAINRSKTALPDSSSMQPRDISISETCRPHVNNVPPPPLSPPLSHSLSLLC